MKLVTGGHPNFMYMAYVQSIEMGVTLHATGYYIYYILECFSKE
jgi:hypothetical protein